MTGQQMPNLTPLASWGMSSTRHVVTLIWKFCFPHPAGIADQSNKHLVSDFELAMRSCLMLAFQS